MATDTDINDELAEPEVKIDSDEDGDIEEELDEEVIAEDY